jgi:hypothetical protein
MQSLVTTHLYILPTSMMVTIGDGIISLQAHFLHLASQLPPSDVKKASFSALKHWKAGFTNFAESLELSTRSGIGSSWNLGEMSGLGYGHGGGGGQLC